METQTQETSIRIPLNDMLYLYGTHAAGGQSNTLIIFVHGLLSGQDTQLIVEGAHLFAQHGFHTFRFDLYSQKADTRSFANTPMSVQSEDIVQVINHTSAHYTAVAIIAHSLGAYLTLLALLPMAHDRVTKLIFWDPSWEPKNIFASNLGIQISAEVINNAHSLPSIAELMRQTHIPILICGAQKGGAKTAYAYHQYAMNKNTRYLEITGADHNFSDSKSSKALYNHSLKWLQKERV